MFKVPHSDDFPALAGTPEAAREDTARDLYTRTLRTEGFEGIQLDLFQGL